MGVPRPVQRPDGWSSRRLAWIRGHKHPLMDVSSSLFAGIYGVDEFSRYTIRARNVKFPEERTNVSLQAVCRCL
jgi:hypothetical protein